jgi:hypothetical protein
MSLLLKFYYFILLLFTLKNSAGNKRIYEKDVLCVLNPYGSNKMAFEWVGWELLFFFHFMFNFSLFVIFEVSLTYKIV